jgi:hypothetical protein
MPRILIKFIYVNSGMGAWRRRCVLIQDNKKERIMSLPEVTEADRMIKIIDDTIRDLKLRRAEIVATLPVERSIGRRITHLSAPGLPTRAIGSRKKR